VTDNSQRLTGAAIGLLLCFVLASCSSSPRVDRTEPLSQPMPDGKRWTISNANAETSESYCYGDDAANCERYGRLYTWAAAQKICASMGAGWRLPSMQDWRDLARVYGGVFGEEPGNGKVAFRELLVGGQSGLELRLGGGRDRGEYARLEAHGFYWSTTEESPNTVRYLNFGKGSGTVYDQNGGAKTEAFSVRCVSDGANLRGVWKVTELLSRAAGGEWTSLPLNESLYIFTDGHYSYMFAPGAEPRRPFSGDPNRPSDAEKVRAYDSIVAASGTYLLSGSTLTLTAQLHKNPSEMAGESLTYTIEIDGDVLRMTIANPPFSPGRERRTTLRRIE
jgi:uncharacterized protein (TIGR02145 family)